MAITEDPVQIIEIKDGRARIRVRRLTMCARCHQVEWAKRFQFFETWIDAKTDVQPGDLVHVEMPSKKFLLCVFIVFGVPMIGLFIGVTTAIVLHLQPAEAAEIVCGLLGVVASYFSIWLLDKYVSERKGFLPMSMKKVKIKSGLLRMANQIN